jgi:hypothetical protein
VNSSLSLSPLIFLHFFFLKIYKSKTIFVKTGDTIVATGKC